VKVAKKKEVQKLMEFFEMPDDDETKSFYADVMTASATGKDDADTAVYNDDEATVL
jgi:hypothetical protein